MKPLYALFLIGAFITTLLGGCATYRSDFGGGYHALEGTYLDKPHYDSLPQGAWYASARAIRASGYNIGPFSPREGDRNRVYEAVVHRGHTYRNLSWAGGLFGYYGNYRLGNRHDSVLVDHFLSRKSYYGFGAKLDVAWNIPYRRVNFRPLGLALTVNRELGRYPRFVRQIDGLSPSVSTVNDPLGINVGITSGLRVAWEGGMVLGGQLLLMIPDRDYDVIYERVVDGQVQPRGLVEGVTTTTFVGYENVLFQVQMGLGEAQLHVAYGLTYRFGR